MRLFFLLFMVGALFALLQSSVFPLLLSPNWRPNLLLILVLYLALSESLFRALIAGLLLGAIQDSFSGTSLGLYISVYLFIVLTTQLLSEQFNTESRPLLLLLIAGATLLQNILIGFFLAFFATAAPPFHLFLFAIPPQILANIFVASIMLSLLLRCQRLLGNRSGLAGLMYQSKRHVS